MDLINCTPHKINLVGQNDEPVAVIPPSENTARVSVSRKTVDTVGVNGREIPVNVSVFGDVIGLPDPKDGVRYIVSRIVADAASDRDDLLIVDDTVRDEEKRIVGCRAFARV